MTAHKSFKRLVRARMQKTGESYTTARRLILHQGQQLDTPAAARCHLPGSVPATTALRILLAHAGVRGPDGTALSEALVFGVAGGIGIGVFQFHYEKEDFASFFLGGRHSWHDDLLYAQSALEDFGLSVLVKESAGLKAADKNLRDALADGTPCMVWVDSAHLPHRALPTAMSGGGYHVLTVYAIDDGEGIAWIGDCTDRPLKIGLPELAEARARIKKFKNRVLWIERPSEAQDLSADELRRLVRSGLKRCHRQLAVPAIKSSAKNFQLAAIKSWSDRLHGSSAKDIWENVFKPRVNLWLGLTWICDSIEHHGTGGGLCRFHMADFLEEAGEALNSGEISSVSRSYRELGAAWCELARAALPDEVPEMRRARELLSAKIELVHDAAPADKVREVWEALQSLEDQVKEQFPLSDEDCDALRAALKDRALSIHAAEVAALSDLEQAKN